MERLSFTRNSILIQKSTKNTLFQNIVLKNHRSNGQNCIFIHRFIFWFLRFIFCKNHCVTRILMVQMILFEIECISLSFNRMIHNSESRHFFSDLKLSYDSNKFHTVSDIMHRKYILLYSILFYSFRSFIYLYSYHFMCGAYTIYSMRMDSMCLAFILYFEVYFILVFIYT